MKAISGYKMEDSLIFELQIQAKDIKHECFSHLPDMTQKFCLQDNVYLQKIHAHVTYSLIVLLQ